MSSTKTEKSNFLAVRLRSRDGHLGRGGKEIQRIADKSGLSVHTVQSLAMGRRTFTEETKASIKDAMADG